MKKSQLFLKGEHDVIIKWCPLTQIRGQKNPHKQRKNHNNQTICHLCSRITRQYQVNIHTNEENNDVNDIDNRCLSTCGTFRVGVEGTLGERGEIREERSISQKNHKCLPGGREEQKEKRTWSFVKVATRRRVM